jgi:hypothetical protein
MGGKISDPLEITHSITTRGTQIMACWVAPEYVINLPKGGRITPPEKQPDIAPSQEQNTVLKHKPIDSSDYAAFTLNKSNM